MRSRRFARLAPVVAGACLAAALALACGRKPAPAALDAIMLPVPQTMGSVDPHADNIFGSFELLSNVYEPLVALDPSLRLQPALALSWESPDPLTWTLRLRPDVRFHSGRLLGAEDVVFSLRRLLQGRELKMRSHLSQVVDVEALDPLGVRLRTRRPVPLLLNHLNFVAIVPAGARDDELRERADGTGPYRLASWTRDGEVRLVRHEGYWGPRPPIRSVVFVLGRSPEQSVLGLRNGRYQIVRLNTSRFDAELARDPRLRLERRENLYLRYLGFGLARAEGSRRTPSRFRDLRVRQAVQRALDLPALVRRLDNDAAPASQLVPRSIFGFAPELTPPRHDPAAARELLRSAGVEAGFGAVLLTRSRFEPAARAVSAALGRVGIGVEVALRPDVEFFDALARGDATLWLSAFGCPLGDASELFENVLHTRDPERGLGVTNYGGYSNPDLDRAIEASASQPSAAARQRALQALMRRASEEVVWAPLYFETDAYAIQRTYAFSPRADGYLRGAEIGLAP